jgi:hypothetical protein
MDEDLTAPGSADRPVYYDLSSLKARGWTARLVTVFLGEPDDTERMTAVHTGRPKNLYCAKRVASIEIHDANFRAEKEKAAIYSARLKQTQAVKKKNLAGLVDDMTLPELDLPFEELLEQANKKILFDENLAGTAPDRVAVGILLDRMASLAWRLEIFSGHAGIREARTLLRTRRLAHFVNRYPPLWRPHDGTWTIVLGLIARKTVMKLQTIIKFEKAY